MSPVAAERLGLERYDSLFIAPHGDDVGLACPGRVLAESESGRRALVLALFAPVGSDTNAARAARDLSADYVAAGLAPASERQDGDEAPLGEALQLLTEIGPRVQPMHVYAPLGLGSSPDHRLAFEASLRAFGGEAGRNLFLYEERPEAFVPGAVRTRLALLGARLPPGATKAAERASALRHLWRVGEPDRLRGERRGLGTRLTDGLAAWRQLRLAGPWNPQRALGPRLHPIVHVADEDARARAQASAHLLLPKDRKGRSRAAERFNHRASGSAKRLGAVYHAERFWLVLPSGDGLPEIHHPLEEGARR